ncbi:hypothetical protein C8R43DRAFT_1112442 [Mycena crocata]|nr:hypothetical protein C8R43DRAFT_1112442 [Mycena crocata]
MFFRLIHCFGFFLLLSFYIQQISALTFNPVVGPYVTGAQVPLTWTLDGSEPATGWELWFSADGAGVKLANIPPPALSTVVPFPGSGNGTFQGLSGTVVLATSNEVDIVAPTTVFASETATFSASVISGPTSSSVDSASSSRTSPSSSSVAESSTAGDSSRSTTSALLGIIVGTLAVIAIIVIVSVALFVHRRRRVAETAYPFAAEDVEKQLATKISPFQFSPFPRQPMFPSRSSPPLPPLPTSNSTPPATGDSRRQAYLNSQLHKLEFQQNSGTPGPESASVVFTPLSSVPSASTTRHFEVRSPPPLPPIPESGSRRDAYLSHQLNKLADVDRRPSDGSAVFGPLSSVPSESTYRPFSQSISTVLDSPIQFRHGPSEATSPISPPATRVAPW